MSPFDMELVARRLRTHTPREVFRGWPGARRAAVAVILDDTGAVLLQRRAARAGDRWSSHVSLPGGMAQAGDRSLLDTALRETREEIGVELSPSSVVGALDELRAVANASLRPMSIAPFVLRIEGRPATTPGPEVVSTFWLPLDRAATGALDGHVHWPVLGLRWRFPCWRWEGHEIWGLTYKTLRALLRLGAPSR